MGQQVPGTVSVKHHPEIGTAVYVVNREGVTLCVYSLDQLMGEGVGERPMPLLAGQYGEIVFDPNRDWPRRQA